MDEIRVVPGASLLRRHDGDGTTGERVCGAMESSFVPLRDVGVPHGAQLAGAFLKSVGGAEHSPIVTLKLPVQTVTTAAVQDCGGRRSRVGEQRLWLEQLGQVPIEVGASGSICVGGG